MWQVWETVLVHTGFWWVRHEGKRTLRRPKRRWEIILKMFFKNWDGDVDWIVPVQDMDICRATVNAILKFRGTLNAGSFLNR